MCMQAPYYKFIYVCDLFMLHKWQKCLFPTHCVFSFQLDVADRFSKIDLYCITSFTIEHTCIHSAYIFSSSSSYFGTFFRCLRLVCMCGICELGWNWKKKPMQCLETEQTANNFNCYFIVVIILRHTENQKKKQKRKNDRVADTRENIHSLCPHHWTQSTREIERRGEHMRR